MPYVSKEQLQSQDRAAGTKSTHKTILEKYVAFGRASASDANPGLGKDDDWYPAVNNGYAIDESEIDDKVLSDFVTYVYNDVHNDTTVSGRCHADEIIDCCHANDAEGN
eukprot:985509_1